MRATRHDKSITTLSRVGELLDRYLPAVLVTEGIDPATALRRARMKKLLQRVEHLAKGRGVRTLSITRGHVRRVFGGSAAVTKHQIAQTIAQQLPDLAPWAPRRRKPWMNEDYWMAVFEAAALALTYFQIKELRRNPVETPLAE